MRAGDRHHLGDRHPVQPVHEVDQIHKPEACQQKQAAFDPERAGRNDPQVRRARQKGPRRRPAPAAVSRGSTGMDLTSSAKPTAAMNSVAPKTATGIFISAVPAKAMTAPATSSVAAITAMPAPCGVGTRCEERAFGLASACRNSSGRIAQVMPADKQRRRQCGGKATAGIAEMVILSDVESC